jgi:hypothetical protein
VSRPTDAIHRNARGSSYDRRRRKQWLLDEWGDGITARCWRMSSARCERWVSLETVTVDRVVMGRDGGRYTHDNIRPSCAPCNYGHGAESRYE